jgi:hypothetical protein
MSPISKGLASVAVAAVLSSAACRSSPATRWWEVGVSGSPGKDDICSQAGIDKVADQLK